MKPPICTVCGRQFPPDGGGDLLYFRSHEDDDGLAEGEVGHPSNAGWFCPDHVGPARELTHLTLPEALDRLDDG